MSEIINILIVGVGGQGTILASKVLAGVVQEKGHEVKIAEIHGMSQRGGSVFTQVRYGANIASPTIPQGEADIILAFEKLEALRWLSYLKKNGRILINDQRIDPMPVIMGTVEYPADALQIIQDKCQNVTMIDGVSEALKAGNIKSVNMVLLGVLSKFLDFDGDIWLKVMQETIPAKFIDVNLKAFEAGRKY
ncbi:MAG: indolepyruvate oxidoreductase subunit beta [Gracilibacter sp. BRH_c7a]|nr:MAG: indolepyruvate oxidoreductase subunit beta [Gracilibacter sp. BRH_c7a]